MHTMLKALLSEQGNDVSRLYRGVAYVCLEIMIHLWALLSFLNFIGWGIRNRTYYGWHIAETAWYDTMIGVVAVFTPMAISVWFMHRLVT